MTEAAAGPGRFRLSIVVPAFNEEANVERALERLTRTASRLCADHEIVVVDDGSTDRTAALVRAAAARDPRIRLVQHRRNRGYGEALRSGFTAARLHLVFFTDADNQFDPEELERFLPWTDHVDVVAGYRVKRGDPFVRRMAAVIWNSLVRVFYYVPVRDIDCAFKVFRRSALEAVDLQSVGAMVNTELMVKLGRAGSSIVELGVSHYPRVGGRARGVKPSVVLRALYELVTMYGRLSNTEATPPLPDSAPDVTDLPPGPGS